MKGLMKSVLIVGQVLGLFAGNNFTTPTLEVLERDPFLHFYA